MNHSSAESPDGPESGRSTESGHGTDSGRATEHGEATGSTALVTGATSGLGLEAAAQFAEAGFARVVVTGRTARRAEAAAAEVRQRTGLDVVESVVVDLDVPASVTAAGEELRHRGVVIDVLLLNAGMVAGNTRTFTDGGVEVTFSSSLIGHHQLTSDLLAAGLLAPAARIVIAGSEAARGDVPTFDPTDLRALAAREFGGDLEAAARSLILGSAPQRYRPADTYADAKVFVAWWAAALSRRLPEGMTVNAVSPGSAPNTDADRNANFYMKRIMLPLFRHAPARFGLAATTPVAASRYLEAAGYGDEVTGRFYASAPRKMTGPLQENAQDHLVDREGQEAGWAAIEAVTAEIRTPTTVG